MVSFRKIFGALILFVQTGSWCFYLSIGTFHTVPRPFALVLGHFTLSQDLELGHFALCQDLVLGYFALSQDPSTQVLGHFALSQDYLLKCWDTSYSPKTSSFICWDSRFPSSSVLGHLDHYPRYQHLSPSVKNFLDLKFGYPRGATLVLGLEMKLSRLWLY